MASAGIGSSNHLVGELFQSVTGTKLPHIPYKGAGAVAGDLMGGQVQLLFDQLAASTANIKSGKLKAFAVTSATRASVLPEVPTMVESGLKEMDVINITGLLAPIGTSPEIVATPQRRAAEGARADGGQGTLRDPRRQPARQHAGAVRDLHPRRLRQVDQGDHRREHQGRVSVDQG